MNLILLGAPGAGKGTQSAVIAEKLQIPTISTGNLLREAVANQTDLGVKAKGFMDAGELVPDELVLGLIKERIAKDDTKNGYILDGFPRNLAQAKALADMGVKIDKVLNISVPDEIVLERLGGRRTCKSCGTVYHVLTNPPKIETVCDKCGGEVYIRDDDREETIKKRLQVYHTDTAPLVSHYEKEGILSTVDGVGSVTDAVARSLQALGV